MNDLKVVFHQDTIEFINYPYEPATVYPSGLIKVAEIVGVITNFNPPAIKIRNNEVLFIPRNKGNDETLKGFAKRNNIRIVNCQDVWAWILEEFLDTEISPMMKEKTLSLLEEQGISRSKYEILKNSIADRMIAYNFKSGLWEWVYLGLYDVLGASAGILSGKGYKLSDKEFKEFYWKAMEIASLGKIL